MLLLAASGFFVKSLLNVSRVDLGIKVDNVITFRLSPALNGYTPERSRVLFQRLEEQLRATPGVTASTARRCRCSPAATRATTSRCRASRPAPTPTSNSRFNAGRTRLLLGDGRAAACRAASSPPPTSSASQKVAIVNEEFVKKFKLGRDAVGKMMGIGRGYRSPLDTVIVGVVQNAKYSDVKRQVPPLFFRPYRQDPDIGSASRSTCARRRDPAQMASAVTAVVRRLDPNLPVTSLKTLTQQVRDNTFLDHMMTTLSSLFAGLATLLAAVGLRRARLHRLAADARDRPAHGARRGAGRVRAMVLRQVALDDAHRRCGRAGGRRRRRQQAGSMLFEMKGADPVVLALSAVR